MDVAFVILCNFTLHSVGLYCAWKEQVLDTVCR